MSLSIREIQVQHFNEVKAYIKDQEAERNMMPAMLEQHFDGNEESWTISFDKLVVYSNIEDQTKDNFYQAKTKLNYGLHKEVLQAALAQDLNGANAANIVPGGMGTYVQVQVKPQYKTFLGIPFKIPFMDIGWERAPNKVRGGGNENLATMPTRITVTLTNVASLKGKNLWDGLNKVACLHNQNHTTKNAEGIDQVNIIATDIAARHSRNPLRWVARLLAYFVPRSLANLFPDFVRASARTKPYGYDAAERVLDYPMFNAGVGAATANAGVSLGVVAGIIGMLYLSLKSNSNEKNNPGCSSLGFCMGAQQPATFGNVIGASLLSGSSNKSAAAFGSSYSRGLLFNSTLNAVGSIGSSGCLERMPFATRTVVRPR